ncbi:MAG: endolytic transglycosylase MltG [Oscillospiraceae bacterium]|jgi:UPF0755 protein|nr:endolytic transglycosylase MltG [Oscillospiraceae bacterium]
MDEMTPGGQPPQGKRPFELDIDFDALELSGELGAFQDPDAPVSKGEIYFANPPIPVQPAVAATGARKRSRKKRKHSGAFVACAMVLILTLSGALSWVGITALRDIFAIGKTGGREIELSIGSDMTTDDMIDMLADHELVQQRFLCKLYADFSFWMRSRHVAEPQQPVYLPGPYKVDASLGLEELLNFFKSKPKSTETTHLVFPEGYTSRQVIEKIGKYAVTGTELLQRTLQTTEFEYPFLQGIDKVRRYHPYEGYLFPDTYEFYLNENPASVLRRFFDNFNSKWTEEYAARAKELNMRVDEVVTLASIIQMEAANKDQMPQVSSVLHNRLKRPEAYPMLECDSTRDYVTKNIAINGMDRGTAEHYYQAYNTYQCTGLPAGPICNPGEDAIEAALSPKSSDYYYFQHDKNGKIYLSETKAEHDKTTTEIVVNGLSQ